MLVLNIIKKKARGWFWISFLIFVLSNGCATTIKTDVLMPGKADQATQFKSIAVLPIGGPDGEVFTSLVENTLANVTIDGQHYFQIVDRGRVETVMNELKLGMTGRVNDDTAALVGKAVGAKGVYTGGIGSSSVQDESYSETRQTCSFYKTVTDLQGRKTQECAMWINSPVSCTRRTAVFGFTPRLIEADSGRLIFSNAYENKVEAKACADPGSVLEDEKRMQKKVQENVLQNFRKDVAPYYVTLSFTLKDSTADIASNMAKAKLRDGLAFAKAKRMDLACADWRDALALAPRSITLMYNVGICDETEGKLHEALALYLQIDKVRTSPDDLVASALARVNEQIENRKKLAGQVTGP